MLESHRDGSSTNEQLVRNIRHKKLWWSCLHGLSETLEMGNLGLQRRGQKKLSQKQAHASKGSAEEAKHPTPAAE